MQSPEYEIKSSSDNMSIDEEAREEEVSPGKDTKSNEITQCVIRVVNRVLGNLKLSGKKVNKFMEISQVL